MTSVGADVSVHAPSQPATQDADRSDGRMLRRRVREAGGATRTLLSVQYARGIAAVSVLLFHAFNDGGVTHYPEQVLQVGVDLFFVISGFIMWVTTFGSSVGPKAFLGKRVRRIVPLYWLFTGVAIVVAAVAPQLGKGTSVGHTVASLLFLPAVNPTTHRAEPLLAPGWTLNHEMLFYVIFALALTLPAKRRLFAVVGANVGLAVVGFLTHGPLLVSFYTNPIILEFVFGVIIGWIYTSGFMASRRLSGVLVSAGVVVMVACAAAWGQTAILRVALWGVPAAVIVLALVLTENTRPVGLRRRWQSLGDASYSIYIVHGVVLSALLSLVHHAGVPVFLMIPVGSPVAVVVGLMVYRYIERPMISYLRPRRRALTIPAPLVSSELVGTVEG
jgi:exopolysaccharide production protein ExoZ